MLRAEAPVKWASNYLAGLAVGRVPRAAGRPIEVGITLPLRTALGLDDLPGELPGYGVLPREVIRTMIRDELPKLRLMVIDPDSGRLVYRAESSHRPTSEQVAQVRATYVFSAGPGSQVMAVRTDTDHVIEAPSARHRSATCFRPTGPGTSARPNGNCRSRSMTTVSPP